jgi:uncharacterized protein GlcG (DUF336 family)
MKKIAAVALAALATVASAADGTFTIKLMTPEIAQKAVNAALADCRKRGYQVAVAVVDRAGVPQALIRDRFAGAHTPTTAINKGWTSVSFRTDTLPFAVETQAGRPSSGIRQLPNVVAVGGGVLIDAGGSTVGAIGVSGAPSGEEDDKCARAGVAAIRADIEL